LEGRASKTVKWIGLEKVSVFGLGRVGLVMAVFLAKHGYRVAEIDLDPNLLRRISKGEASFYEANLTEYLTITLWKKRFTVTQDYSINSQSDLAYIAVGTPSRKDVLVDIGYVEEASRTIDRLLFFKVVL
jgi:UDP-glucose 6-dehydrogenase